MDAAARPHPLEYVIDWSASAVLAAAAGWAAWRLGWPAQIDAGAAVAALGIGIAVMGRFGSAGSGYAEASFEPVQFAEAEGETDELLLDDPLIEIEPDSRVVRLFARDSATPGEMVTRIEDYLGEGSRAAHAPAAVREESASPPDASAALHAALANIRASLR